MDLPPEGIREHGGYRKGWSFGRARQPCEGYPRSPRCRSARRAVAFTNKPHAEDVEADCVCSGFPWRSSWQGRGADSEMRSHRATAGRAAPAAFACGVSRPNRIILGRGWTNRCEMFTLLLSSPLAESLARIVEESARAGADHSAGHCVQRAAAVSWSRHLDPRHLTDSL